MRKWNNRIVKLIMILFLVHGLMGSFMMLGISTVVLKPLSWLLLTVVMIHAFLGIIATIQAVRAGRKTGNWYFLKNTGFWVKRISGMAIVLLLIFHMNAYTTTVNGVFFLKKFTFLRMISQLLFVLAIFIHIFVSLRSMLITRGIVKFKERRVDWMIVLSLFMLMFIIAIITYYIEWKF